MNKEEMERKHSAQMNEEAAEKIKADSLTKDEADRIEAVFFEDEESITLGDGKIYSIPPASLKNARRLMQSLKTINIDAIILNFLPSGDDEADRQREEDLFKVLEIAFVKYPEMTKEYMEEYIDVATAKEIINILIGLNALKKQLA